METDGMTREIKLTLLAGLAFIVLFGVIISTGTRNNRTALLTSLSTPTPSRLDTLRETVILGDRLSQLNPKKKTRGDKNLEKTVDKVPPAPGGDKQAKTGSRDPSGTTFLPQDDSLPKSRRIVPPQGPTASPNLNPGNSPYTVQPGDSWYKIARSQWGTGYAHRWKRIYEANKKLLKNDGALLPGVVLQIPPRPDGSVP